MIKRIQLADVSRLYTSQSIVAVAKYVHSCVAQKMSVKHIPEFVAALKACLAQKDNTALSKQLHAAVIGMANTVDLHLQLIDYIAAEARAHASQDTPAIVLSKMSNLRSQYLSTVSAQLLTCAQADLQQVIVLLLIPAGSCVDVDIIAASTRASFMPHAATSHMFVQTASTAWYS